MSLVVAKHQWRADDISDFFFALICVRSKCQKLAIKLPSVLALKVLGNLSASSWAEDRKWANDDKSWLSYMAWNFFWAEKVAKMRFFFNPSFISRSSFGRNCSFFEMQQCQKSDIKVLRKKNSRLRTHNFQFQALFCWWLRNIANNNTCNNNNNTSNNSNNGNINQNSNSNNSSRFKLSVFC